MNTTSIISLIVLVITALASAFVGPIGSFWAAHPDLLAAVVAIWGAVAHFLPAPTTPAKAAEKAEAAK